jgi:hypothetical protein
MLNSTDSYWYKTRIAKQGGRTSLEGISWPSVATRWSNLEALETSWIIHSSNALSMSAHAQQKLHELCTSLVQLAKCQGRWYNCNNSIACCFLPCSQRPISQLDVNYIIVLSSGWSTRLTDDLYTPDARIARGHMSLTYGTVNEACAESIQTTHYNISHLPSINKYQVFAGKCFHYLALQVVCTFNFELWCKLQMICSSWEWTAKMCIYSLKNRDSKQFLLLKI